MDSIIRHLDYGNKILFEHLLACTAFFSSTKTKDNGAHINAENAIKGNGREGSEISALQKQTRLQGLVCPDI